MYFTTSEAVVNIGVDIGPFNRWMGWCGASLSHHDDSSQRHNGNPAEYVSGM
jgi:hypothetical protein